MDIKEALLEKSEKDYADFTARLVFTDYGILGVRQPVIKQLAKKLVKEGGANDFLNSLPYETHEENLLYGYIVGLEKDYGVAQKRVDDFLSYVDNWAVCDCLKVKCFSKHKTEVLKKAYSYLESDKTFTKRFGVKLFVDYFLGSDFSPEYALAVDGVKSEEYYVNMMQAWYFATAIVKNEREVLPFFERGLSNAFVHNTAIRKARESYRVADGLKEYLKTLRR